MPDTDDLLAEAFQLAAAGTVSTAGRAAFDAAAAALAVALPDDASEAEMGDAVTGTFRRVAATNRDLAVNALAVAMQRGMAAGADDIDASLAKIRRDFRDGSGAPHA